MKESRKATFGMPEKVLGFRKSEVTQCSNLGEGKISHYLVHKNKLVPVVSLERLEKYREEQQKEHFGKKRLSEYADGWEAGHDAALRDCFLQEKKEGEEK